MIDSDRAHLLARIRKNGPGRVYQSELANMGVALESVFAIVFICGISQIILKESCERSFGDYTCTGVNPLEFLAV